jgi:SAM-dependent methyltransferase
MVDSMARREDESNPAARLAAGRQGWRGRLRPPVPAWHNPDALAAEPPLGRWNLYIGGAAVRPPGYLNVDLFGLPGVDVVCDAERLPFRDDVFDRVECPAVLEHTPRPAKLVAEIHRCLRPGGVCRLVAPFCHPFHEHPRDYWRFTLDGLAELVRPMEVFSSGWQTGPTATLLAFFLEYLKLWTPGAKAKKLVWAAGAWLLFPLRYLDILLLRRPDARQLGNHGYIWSRKPPAGRSIKKD